MPRVIEPSDQLLDLVYDAATEPELWCSALTKMADLTGSQGGIIFGQSFGASMVHFDYNGRLSEECNRAYKERHANDQSPWNRAMMSQPVRRVVLSDEVVPLSDLRQTLLYEEVLRPQDVAHNTMIALAARQDFCVAFNICRSERQGPIGGEARRFLERLVPHMHRSFQLGFRVEGYHALQRAEYHVLDCLSVGIVLLDRSARIVYLNTAARSFAVQDGPLSLRNGSIATHSVPHSQRLAELIRAVLKGRPTASMSVPRPTDGSLLTILMSSIRGRDVGRFADIHMPNAAVLLIIVDPTNRDGIPIGWVMDAYGLTQAEARVALAASSGGTIPEIASQLALSQNTIKTHLRKVFAKTATNRQTELVRLMSSIGLLRAKPQRDDR
jgi:DNA-binding CsgD family transcriptional regulator